MLATMRVASPATSSSECSDDFRLPHSDRASGTAVISDGNTDRVVVMKRSSFVSVTSSEWSDECRGVSSSSAVLISDVSGELLARPSITSTLAPSMRRGNDISDFTIDKLKYASLGLHGRESELVLLHDKLTKMMAGESPEHERQLLFLSGYSGTGKTALAQYALKASTEKLGGLFVRGKFELELRNQQPYAGISAACTEICNALLELKLRNPSGASQEIFHHIQTELGSELALLMQVIPGLADVVTLEEEPSASTISVSASSADAKNQIIFAFLRFLKAVSNHFVPLVIILDDLQWADRASINLLEALFTDPTNTSKLMVVGIYRSNEVDETHILHHMMQELDAKNRPDPYFEMTCLTVGNLGVDSVQSILQQLLGMDGQGDSSRTLAGLADVCYSKTHGNVFVLLQFVSVLKERQMLQFNFGMVSWTWDEKEIDAKTKASDNVVDFLKTKMAVLSDELLHLLKLAACLGSTFEVRMLHLVWKGSRHTIMERAVDKDQDEENRDTLLAKIATLEAEGYLVKNESRATTILHLSYSWSHDKVQEAALSLVPESEQGLFAAQIGQVLLTQLEEKELDYAIFVVVNLLNGAVDSPMSQGGQESRLDLARLNDRASRKAILCSAFDSAAGYAAKGIQLLPENAWIDHYELALNLYTIGARAEGVLGNTETMERYCQQVVSQTDRPMEDKFGVYSIWIDSLYNRVLLDEAKDLALDILKKFKCRFPKNSTMVSLGVLGNMIGLKATMKSRNVSMLNTLNDTTRIELMKLLDRLMSLFYVTKDDRMPLVIFKSLNWTLKYGYCDYSSVSFATTGLILTGGLNDLQGGSKYGEQALILLERSKSRVTAARTIVLVYAFAFSWTKPHRSLLKPLLQGYDVGLQSGDTESAMYSIYLWLLCKYAIGSPLECLESDCFLYWKQMKALKRDQAGHLTKALRQVFLNLLGRDNSDKPTRFSGSALSEEQLECFRDNPFFGPMYVILQGILFTYFGDYVQYADIILELGHDHFQKAHMGSICSMWDTFFKGVSCFAAAQETRNKKYAKLGQVFRCKIKSWLDQGNPNVKHYALLLDAEWTAYHGSKHDAIKQYEAAILMAARGGYQHDAALATQRFGEFYLTVMNDREDAAYQIGQSIQYWMDWGAVAKVRQLEEKYADLLA